MANFDPQILTLMRETEQMIQLGFDIPPAAKALLSRQADITKLYQSVAVRISSYYIRCTRRDNNNVHAKRGSDWIELDVYKNKLGNRWHQTSPLCRHLANWTKHNVCLILARWPHYVKTWRQPRYWKYTQFIALLSEVDQATTTGNICRTFGEIWTRGFRDMH